MRRNLWASEGVLLRLSARSDHGMTINLEQARGSRAWPFQEAERLLRRVEQQPPPTGYVLFETGYGPSGLPHIGTFGEVFRTTVCRRPCV